LFVNQHGGSNYQWFNNNNPIPGANVTVYIPSETGYYHCEITNSLAPELVLSSEIFPFLSFNQPIYWRSLEGLEYDRPFIIKTRDDDFWINGGRTYNQIDAFEDGSITFSITDGLGFEYDIGFADFSITPDELREFPKYAWRKEAAVGGFMNALYLGTSVAVENFAKGDWFSVERQGTTIKWYKNQILVAQMPVPREILVAHVKIKTRDGRTNLDLDFGTTPFEIKHEILRSACGYNTGAINLTIDGGVPPYTYNWSNGMTSSSVQGLAPGNYSVTVMDAAGYTLNKSYTIDYMVFWTDIVGMSNDYTTQTLTKTAGDGWGNGGAASFNFLQPFQSGSMEFEISESNDSHFIIGLSDVNTDAHFNSIDYAFYNDKGNIEIFENGISKVDLGNASVGDVFKIKRLFSSILYYHNTYLVRIISTNANTDLKVDVSAYTNGSEIRNVGVSFCNWSPIPLPLTNTASQLSHTGSEINIISDQNQLEQNFPNPFNSTTTIHYSLMQPGQVTLKIYNMEGKEVRTLVYGTQNGGFHDITWDGKNNQGNQMPGGTYLYRLEAGDFTQTNRMLILR